MLSSVDGATAVGIHFHNHMLMVNILHFFCIVYYRKLYSHLKMLNKIETVVHAW